MSKMMLSTITFKVWLRAMTVLAIFAALQINPVATQTTAQSAQTPAHSLADTWQGTLDVGKGLRTVLKIAKADAGYKATFYSIDQGGDGIPVSKITLDGATVTMAITAIDGRYEGSSAPMASQSRARGRKDPSRCR